MPLHQFEPEKPGTFPVFRNLKIMIAEDNQLMQHTMKLLFSKWGCTPSFVTNGKQAVECMQQQQYDLVLMDINMPEMNGLEATKAIRTFNPKVPVIAFTTLDGAVHQEVFKNAGITAYLSKFASPEIIMKTILSYTALQINL
jgi:CheY-like chemotaxis protein